MSAKLEKKDFAFVCSHCWDLDVFFFVFYQRFTHNDVAEVYQVDNHCESTDMSLWQPNNTETWHQKCLSGLLLPGHQDSQHPASLLPVTPLSWPCLHHTDPGAGAQKNYNHRPTELVWECCRLYPCVPHRAAPCVHSTDDGSAVVGQHHVHDAGPAYRHHSPPGDLSVHHHCKGLARSCCNYLRIVV